MQSRKRTRHTQLLFAVIALSLMTLGHVHGADQDAQQDAQQKALNIISKFANDICTKIPLEGHGTEINLSGQAKAELNGILKRIADLGIEGSGDYKDAEYQGIIQNELAEAIKNADTCRFNVFKELKDKLVPSTVSTQRIQEPTTSATIPTQTVLFWDDFETETGIKPEWVIKGDNFSVVNGQLHSLAPRRLTWEAGFRAFLR